MTVKTSVAPIAQRAAAVVAALEAKGLLTPGQLDPIIEAAQDWRPENGAQVVAKAWTDSAYKDRLLNDGTAACAELGYSGPQGEHIVALENTSECHNVIVCTQCSCTAWPVLGLPPDWYKSPEYRARVVREPRKVLREMGLVLNENTRVRVWETSAETRYLVIPLRPEGTEGFAAQALAKLIPREALVGIGRALRPSE